VQAFFFVCSAAEAMETFLSPKLFYHRQKPPWTAARVIAGGGGFDWPYGLRFTADGSRLVVADVGHERLCILCAKEGSFLCHVALPPDVYPADVEELINSGWLVCTGQGVVAMVSDTGQEGPLPLSRQSFTFVLERPFVLGLAIVPGLGLVVRHVAGVQFLATPAAAAMAAMSECKVAWMTAVCRAADRTFVQCT